MVAFSLPGRSLAVGVFKPVLSGNLESLSSSGQSASAGTGSITFLCLDYSHEEEDGVEVSLSFFLFS